MSWWVKEINTISEDESERLCIIETDTPNDLPNPVRTKPDPDNPGQTITDYTIVRGSEAYCLSNSKFYKLNSQGNWIEQTEGSGGGGGASSADQVSYDNTDSGLTATNVQDAIDELHDTDEMQDRGLAELYAENTNQQLEIDYAINTGAKNLLQFNGYGTGAENGVTYVINSDGTININGTPQGTSPSYIELKLNGNAANVARFCDGNHILSGCPEGGSDSTYRMYAARSTYSRFDYGDGVLLTNTTLTDVRLVVYIANGYTANNLVFKPMIRRAEITDDSYESYAPTNRELYETKTEQTETNVIANLGAKNMLYISNSPGYTATSHGRTFTVLSDGGIKITGASSDSSNADFYIIGSWGNRSILINENRDSCLMRMKCDTDYGYNQIRLRAMNRSTGSTANDTGVGTNEDAKLYHVITTVFLSVFPSVTLPEDGIVIYPMIRRAEITDNTFQPYAPTNRELYEMILALQNGRSVQSVNPISTLNLSRNDLNESLDTNEIKDTEKIEDTEEIKETEEIEETE